MRKTVLAVWLLVSSIAVLSGGAATSTVAGRQAASGVSANRVVSNADFDVIVVRNVMVPMRDGVRLATDIYFPASNGERRPGGFPVVLERTVYNKMEPRLAAQGEFFARRGYVSVGQDVRGRYASEGTFYIYTEEVNDGYDTIQWINKQPWSNGKIGITGGSYTAGTAHSMLQQNPAGVAAAFIRHSSSNYHEDGAWQGGAFELAHNVSYATSLGANGKEAGAASAVSSVFAQASQRFAEKVRLTPFAPGASFLALAPSYERWYQDWQAHDLFDDYWKQGGYTVERLYDKAADVPVLFLGGWYDFLHRGTMNNFLGYSQHNASPVHVHIQANVHGPDAPERDYAGEVDFGPDAAVIDARPGTRMMMLNLQWFDRWLKGMDNGVKNGDLVRLFRMEPGDGRRNPAGRLQAGGRWQEFDAWPPRDVRFTDYYLTADRGLQRELPGGASFTYSYDPANPVPTIGGVVGQIAPGSGPYDQRCRRESPFCRDELPLDRRPDVLSFTTPPMAENLEVTGPLAVHLWISSNATDTDFAAKLIDAYPPTPEYPDGYAMNLADSIVRARFRSFEQRAPGFHRVYAVKDEPLEPGQVYEVVIDMRSTSYLFKVGHRLRLDVSSSNFPQFDANSNTGEPYARRRMPPVVARNTVHVGGSRPSRIVLPVRPSGATPTAAR